MCSTGFLPSSGMTGLLQSGFSIRKPPAVFTMFPWKAFRLFPASSGLQSMLLDPPRYQEGSVQEKP